MIFPCNSTLPLKQKFKVLRTSLSQTRGGLGGARTLRARAPPSGAFKGSPTRPQLGELSSNCDEKWAPRVADEVGRAQARFWPQVELWVALPEKHI